MAPISKTLKQIFSEKQMRLAIVGLGISGRTLLKFLELINYPKNLITSFSDNPSEADFHDSQQLLKDFNPQVLIVSPGYPLKSSWIIEFQKNGFLVTNESEIAFSFIKAEKVIGVTGSVGKSTVVALLEQGFKAVYPETFVGGNYGVPLLQYVIDLKKNLRPPAEWVVVELSSYQLENFRNLKLHIAAICSFFSNHLERYESRLDYFKTKWKIFDQAEMGLINAANPMLVEFSKTQINSKIQTVTPDQFDLIKKSKLVGSFQGQNAALALSILKFSLPEISDFRKASDPLLNFKGLPHRLEFVAEINSTRFINDSKSTTVDSVVAALSAVCESACKVLLLLGGRDKNLPWQTLGPELSKNNFKNIQIDIIFFGQDGDKIKKISGLPGIGQGPSLKSIIPLLAQVFQNYQTVLLSPGGTSWDEFKSFNARGDFFKKEILQLKACCATSKPIV